MWVWRRSANGPTELVSAQLLSCSASPVLWRSLGKRDTLRGRFLSLKPPGIARRPQPSVTCLLFSGAICGAQRRFPHHFLILMWISSLALLLSEYPWPSVRALEMYKVKRLV